VVNFLPEWKEWKIFFSFFKYSNRNIFLKNYLNELGFKVSKEEAEEAEFRFWPVFEDGTEPDLVIIVGKYYILFEAKYYSGFGKKTETTDDQLKREIEGGQLEAFSYGKEFYLIAITADYYFKRYKFEAILPDFQSSFKWTNWQSVSSFLDNILSSNPNIKGSERDFCLDLYCLLDKKNLRSFQNITNVSPLLQKYSSIFFQAKTAKFRGDFIGFIDSLSFNEEFKIQRKIIFFKSNRKMFKSLLKSEKLKQFKSAIFLKEE